MNLDYPCDMNSACRTANAECVNVCRCKALYYDDNPQYLGGTCQLSKSPGIACLVPSSWIAFPLTVRLNNRLMTCFNQLIIVWPNIINYPFVWFRFQVIVCLNHCLLVMCFNRCPNMCTLSLSEHVFKSLSEHMFKSLSKHAFISLSEHVFKLLSEHVLKSLLEHVFKSLSEHV